MTQNQSSTAQTVLVLGASNVALSWHQLSRVLRERYQSPLHVLTAHGMGRSYVAQSRFAWRTTPGILECDLWRCLDEDGLTPPSSVLITDLGNDLVYGRSAKSLLAAVDEVITRVRNLRSDCEIVVTRPPVTSVESLSAIRFRLFRTAIFPFCDLSLPQAIDATRELDAGVAELEGVSIVNPKREWFGLDPIHIRRRFRAAAFEAFIQSWPAADIRPEVSAEMPRLRPQMHKYQILGRERIVDQPAVTANNWQVSAW